MNENTIDELLLKKNIELLKLYKGDESEKIKQIFVDLNNCVSYYKTSNTTAIVNSINSLIGNSAVLIKNREEYYKTIEKVILRYNKTAKKVVDSFKKAGDSIGV